ncbi:A24 family peptidase [Bradyrhizobium sp. NP1]|jgi:leader peptidase (prepilin peptidase)/N-methyltransferase|uniref:prepilin peptidase n=1 Tax=Bradyrhizobium sp. NP1 TaxID=3049772 RepID=UPI0025A58018|nr:A24 family peptidase [Bradyrhizobium sp. NP1]WJR79995.1 A24 family peptidase [Bradyrhizobium sp. NP1]
MLAAICFALLCVASALLAWIDIKRGIIPDWLNLAIAIVGLARALSLGGWTVALQAFGEGIAIGAVLWLLRALYFRIRKFHGLGLGDVKLLAASGIWIGVAGVPLQLLIASLTALATAGILHVAGQTMTRQTVLPFGPFLALGLLVTAGLQQSGF